MAQEGIEHAPCRLPGKHPFLRFSRPHGPAEPAAAAGFLLSLNAADKGNVPRLIILVIAIGVAATGATSAAGDASALDILMLLAGGIGIGAAATVRSNPRPTTDVDAPQDRDRKTTGAVKWFNQSKGFGFLVPDDGSPDCFVHHSAIEGNGFRALQQGERVEFTVTRDERGRRTAANVKLRGR